MLKALLDDFHRTFFNNKKLIQEIEEKHGSPLHLLYPKNFWKNIDSFVKVFTQRDMKYKIYYAHKSNKSKVFLEEAFKKNISIDVASLWELKNALDVWFHVDNIEATWPKNKKFLQVLISHNILINIDSFSELESIVQIKKEFQINQKIKILLRISWFSQSKISRFGIELSQKEKLLSYLSEFKSEFHILWLSFHLDTVEVQEKVYALEEILKLQKDFLQIWIIIRKINIGWWFRLSYLESKTSWDAYLELLRKELIDVDTCMTWKKSSYGFEVVNNKIFWQGNIYPPYIEITAEKYLASILDARLEYFWWIQVCEYLKENLIELQVEPGRSLHHLTGSTLTKVIATKEIWNEILVTLDINSFSLGSREQELFVDPILISQDRQIQSKKWVFFTGNLCLESDFVYRHKSFLWYIPQVWDILIFPNTAGYFMDFYENTAIMQDLAKKIYINTQWYTLLTSDD